MALELKIVRDTDPINPREWDNLGTMMCFHPRYNLGDKDHANLYIHDFNDWKGMEDELYKRGAVVVLPLYLYDHSGITMRVGSFSDPFDSGQVGFIYVMREKVLKEYNLKRNITKKTIEKVTAVLKCEVETYDKYLTGDVWGYLIEDEEGEYVDSCYGYFGEDCAQADGEVALKFCEEEARQEEERLRKEDPETYLIDKLERAGISLRTTIGGFVDAHRLTDQWVAYLHKLNNDLEGG